jgi:hypothetical protein
VELLDTFVHVHNRLDLFRVAYTKPNPGDPPYKLPTGQVTIKYMPQFCALNYGNSYIIRIRIF